ncbi:hypothetical protein ACSFBF_04255 [Variovorax sp. ZT5P49]|uniref:hypothetical protein n=1 Tax=Variovorax sp. ZT5P49 TaxID=3443733 RepID=UPI003F44890A
MALEHRQHRRANAPQLTFRRLAGSEAGYVQQTKNAAKEHGSKKRIAGSENGRYLKPQLTISQDLKRCFLFVNNTLYLAYLTDVVFCNPKYYKLMNDPLASAPLPAAYTYVVNTIGAKAVSPVRK